MMKKNLTKLMFFAIAVCFVLSLTKVSYAERKIGLAVGEVSIISGAVQTPAQSGAVLKEGDRIKTSAQSRAEIIDGESKVWLRENSEIEVKPAPANNSIFSLIAGKIRAKVKLIQGSKFQVNSPVAVASVRGTDFAFDAGGQLVVFEGTVEFADMGLTNTVPVEAGNLGRILENGAPAKEALSPEQIAAHSQEWQEIITPPSEGKAIAEEKLARAEKKDEKLEKIKDELASELLQMRKEIREMVREIRNDVVVTRDLTNEIKQADIASGRTLIDRFGNLVRVEQQLLRPSPDTIQLVNITKRDTYKYNGFFGANTYQGSSSNRVDIADAKIQFNMALPNDITEWPSFMSNKGEDLKPDKITLTMSNTKDKMEIVSTRQKTTETKTYYDYIYKEEPVYDQFGNIMYYNYTWEEVPYTVTETVEKMEGETFINGWKVDKDYDSRLHGPLYPDPDKDDSLNELAMWGKSPDFKVTKDGQTKYISIWSENYGINNSGALLSKDTFANSSENPFVLLKNVAFQSVIFVKELNDPTKFAPETPVDTAGVVKSDFFEGRNIDIVLTPDLFISVATKIGPQLGNIKTTSSSDSPSYRSIGLLPL